MQAPESDSLFELFSGANHQTYPDRKWDPVCRLTNAVCLENLDSDVMMMKPAENGASVQSAKMLDRAS
jgi:hypothetical protein